MTLNRLLAFFLLLPIACTAPTAQVAAPPCPTTAAVIPLSAPVAEEISVEQLKLLLPHHPITVGFDVDDTLIFSAPAFNALQPGYDPDVIRPKNFNALTSDQKAKFHEFWNKLNEEYDDRSIPKKIGQRLLDLHIARGDEIFIISKRQSTFPTPPVDACTKRYEKMFNVKLPHPVIQTQLQDKTPFICKAHIDYYYGDADTDVTAAVAAGAVPIRVKRAADSYSKDKTHNGQLGEIVIKDSDH